MFSQIYTFIDRRVFVLFLCWTLLIPAPFSNAGTATTTPQSTPQATVSKPDTPPTMHGLPQNLGTYIAQYGYDNPDADRELLVLIDAHDNLSAQYNIAGILDHLTTHADLRGIYLEGACGELQPDEYFSIFDDPEITKTTGDFLLKNGFITGSEYYSITRKNPVPLHGAEKSEVYRDNLSTLRQLKQLNIEVTINQLLGRYNHLIQTEMESDFSQLDSQYMDTVSGGTDIMRFVTSMCDVCEQDITKNSATYPVLSRFMYISKYGSTTVMNLIKILSGLQNTYAADKETVARIGEVKKHLLQSSQQYQAIEAAYTLLKNYRDDIDTRILKATEDYKAHLAYIDNLSPADLYVQILKAYGSLYSQKGYNADIFEYRNALIGLAKGCALTLSPRELEYFDLKTTSCIEILTSLVSHDDGARILVKQFIADGVAEQLTQTQTLIEKFYSTVEQRNTSISAKLDKNIAHDTTAVLVIGGYHKDICQRFVDKGFKVSLVAPALSLSSGLERNVTYTDYLSGVFSSLETMIYYAWSTIISPIISEAIEQLPSRKDAIAPIVARQLAFMLGTGLYIQKQYDNQITHATIQGGLLTLFNREGLKNERISRAFDELNGPEVTPVWPKLLEFKPLADKQGVFAVFSIGSEQLGLQLVPSGISLSAEDRLTIRRVQAGYSLSTTLTVSDEQFTATISSLKQQKQQSISNEAAAVSEFFFAKQQTIPKDVLEDIADTVPQTHLPDISDKIDIYLDDLRHAANLRNEDQIRAIASESQPDGGFDRMIQLLNATKTAAANLSYKNRTLAISIPGETRPVEILLVPRSRLLKHNLSAFTIPRDDRIRVYLPLEYIENDDIPNLFQLLKYELDVNVYGVSPVMAVLQEAISNKFKNDFGTMSIRLQDEMDRQYHPDKIPNTLDTFIASHTRLGNYIALESQVLAAIRRDTTLNDQQKQAAEELTTQIADYARVLRMNYENIIAEKKGVLRGFTFKERLETGGYGTIFLAEKDKKLYVVKMVNPLIENPDLLNQAKTTQLYEAYLTHLVYNDVYQDDCGDFNKGENRFIAVPYTDSVRLDKAFSKYSSHPLSFKLLVQSIAREIKRVHDMGVIHNDLKPENILIQDMPDSFARIIDFGGAMEVGASAETFDEITIAMTKGYQSPEMQCFMECYNIVKSLHPQFDTAELTVDEFNSFMSNLDYLISKMIEFSCDKEAYETLQYEVMLDVEEAFNKGDYTSFKQIISEIEAPVLKLMYSLITPQSDIYSFGSMLQKQMSTTGIPPGLKEIITKCMYVYLEDRYQSMDEVIADINQYFESITNRGFSAAHWIAHPVSSIETNFANTLASWEKLQFSSQQAQMFAEQADWVKSSQPELQKMLVDVMFSEDTSFDGGLSVLASITDQIAQQLSTMEQPQQRLVISIPESTVPIHVYLVNHSDLADVGVNALTVPYEDRTEIYLPGDLLYGESQNVFFQLLKHEIDETVLGYPHTVAVLLESILNTKNLPVVGMTSERIGFEFSYRFEDAVKKGNLSVLYKLGDYYRKLIANEDQTIAEIESNTLLNDSQREMAIQLAGEISRRARIYAVKVDQAIAQNKGELHGFKIIRSIGKGVSSEVFLAEKDGQQWAIKLLDLREGFSQALFERKKRTLLAENSTYKSIYNDAYTGYTGSFEKGENQFLAMPFVDALPLAQVTIPIDYEEDQKIALAMSIVKACQQVEDKGFVHNDLTPYNIYVNLATGFAKVLDFGASVKPGTELPGYISLNHQYAPPELVALISSMAHIKATFELVDSALSGDLSPNDIDIIQDQLTKGFEGSITRKVYNQILDNVIPQLEVEITREKFSSANQLADRFKQLVNETIFSVIDTKRDTFSIGVILDTFVFKGVYSSETHHIIDRAKSHNPFNRYWSFSSLYFDLDQYHQRLLDSRIRPRASHWIGTETPSNATARKAVATWKPMAIPSDLALHTAATKDRIVSNYDNLHDMVFSTLTPFDSTYDGGVARFVHVLDAINDRMREYDGSTPYIELSVFGLQSPLRIYLVDQANLQAMGVSALTVRDDDAVNMYLPASLLNVSDRHVFFQILKHELDESVYFESHTMSVLLESLVNLNEQGIGIPSDRVVYDFEQRLRYAKQQKGDLDLLDLLDYFTGLVANEQEVIREIQVNNTLPPLVRQNARDLARNMSGLARFYAMKTEQAIADKGGTLRGFTFKKMLTSTTRSNVYLAEKDGQQWAVTMYHIADHTNIGDFFESIATHPETKIFASSMYEIYQGETGKVIEGHQPFVAMPYNNGTPLIEHKMSFSAEDRKSIDIAIAIVDELDKLQQQGIVHHHITPYDIFINKQNGTVQIPDLSAALNAGYLPSDIEETPVMLDADYKPYAAPELKALASLQTTSDIVGNAIEIAFTDTIDRTFIMTVSTALGVKLRPMESHEALTTVIPALESLIGQRFTSASEVREIAEKALIDHYYGKLDSRVDIYALGKVLKNDVFWRNIPTELNYILNKATSEDLNERYGSFNLLRQALISYRDKGYAALKPAEDALPAEHHFALLASHFLSGISEQPQDIAQNAVQSWEIRNFEPAMAKVFEEARSELQKIMPQHQPALAKLFTSENTSDAGYSEFNTVLDELQTALDKIYEPQQTITLNSVSTQRPMVLHLTTSKDLSILDTNILSIPQSDRIDVYMAYGAINENSIGIVFQQLKEIVDTNYTAMPPMMSAVVESLLNSNRQPDIATVSDRIDREFARRLMDAVDQKSLDMLYELLEDLGVFIDQLDEVLSAIDAIPQLDSYQKTNAKKLAIAISEQAAFVRAEAEYRIAELGGIVRGFEFERKVGEGNFAAVYLAHKNNELWMVKMLKRAYSSIKTNEYKTVFQPSFEREQIIGDLVYDDFYPGDTGRYELGENTFIVMPFEQGKTLKAFQQPRKLTQRLEMAISIVKEFMKLENSQTSFNDVKPENIFIRSKDNSVRILDFGCSMNPRVQVATFSSLVLGTTPPYTSPEIMSLSHMLNDLRPLLADIKDQTRETFDPASVETLKKQLQKIASKSTQPKIFEILVDQLIPEIVQSYQDGTFATPEQMGLEIEAYCVPAMMSFIDIRSDIYGVGMLLGLHLIDNTDITEIENIILRSVNKSPEKRYQHFSEMLADLQKAYDIQKSKESRFTLMPESIRKFFTAHFVGVSPGHAGQDIAQAADSLNTAPWKTHPMLDNLFATTLTHFRESVEKNYPMWREQLSQTMYRDDPSQDAGLGVFIETLKNIEQAFKSQEATKDTLIVNIPNETRPLHLKLVDRDQLDELSTNAITVAHEDHIEIYLPHDVADPGVFVILKHEIDEFVYNTPHTLAVLQESIFDSHGEQTIGKASRRINSDFMRLYLNAKESGDLNDLNETLNYFVQLIESQDAAIAELDENTAINDTQRYYARQLAVDVSQRARSFAMLIEIEIANNNGTLRGFTFKTRISGGNFCHVYLAEKGGVQYVVKVPKVDYDKPFNLTEFRREEQLTNIAYNDVVFDESDPLLGQLPMLVIPYRFGSILPAEERINGGEQVMVEQSLAFIAELQDMEQRGIVHNDLKPENLLFNFARKTVRILDFGCAVDQTHKPLTLADCMVGMSARYSSPETNTFLHIVDTLKRYLNTFSLAPQDQLNELWFPGFEKTVRECMDVSYTPQPAQFILDTVIPTLKILVAEGKQQEAARMLEPHLIDLLYGLVDHRSDIYAAGNILRHHLLPEKTSGALDDFIAKATASQRDDRFNSFADMYDALAQYYRQTFNAEPPTTQPMTVSTGTDIDSITAHWVSQAPPATVDIIAQVNGWESQPIPDTLIDIVNMTEPTLQEDYSKTTTRLRQKLNPVSNDYDGNLGAFIDILKNMRLTLEMSPPADNILKLYLPGQEFPVSIHFVSFEQLDTLGVSALTLKQDNALHMYLPSEAVSNEYASIFFQLLKHELDENVFGLSHTEAVILESLLNSFASNDPGNKSDRIVFDFSRRLGNAFRDEDLDTLYEMHTYFESLIEREAQTIEEINANTALTKAQKAIAANLARDITKSARFLGLQTEIFIAESGGTLRGFTFEKPLGSGTWGSVYLASKQDGTKWAVKMLNMSMKLDGDRSDIANRLYGVLSSPSITGYLLESRISMHNNDAECLAEVYDDAEIEPADHLKQGKNQFMAVPYTDGTTLPEHPDELPESLLERVDIAISIVEELIRLPKSRIIHNDIKPNNLFMNFDGGCRVLDFGTALNLKKMPKWIKDVQAVSTYSFSSPELLEYQTVVSSLQIEMPLLGTRKKQIEMDLLERIKYIIDDALPYCTNKAPYSELEFELFPEIMSTYDNGICTITADQRRRLNELLVQYTYSLIDTRSDIYSFGVILAESLFPSTNRPSHIQEMIAKMLDKNRNKRYGSFRTILSDLRSYRTYLEGIETADKDLDMLRSQPWFADTVLSPSLTTATIIGGFKVLSFNQSDADVVSAYANQLEQRLPAIKNEVARTITSAGKWDTQSDAGIGRFIRNLNAFGEALSGLEGPKAFVTIYPEDSTRPVYLHLLTDQDLRSIGTDRLTVASDEGIDIYLSNDLLTKLPHIFFQHLKHEIDVAVYGIPEPVANLTDALLNDPNQPDYNAPATIGSISNRLQRRLRSQLEQSITLRSTQELHKLAQEFRDIQESGKILLADIEGNTQLTPVHKDAIAAQNNNMIKESVYYGILLDQIIAERGGSLRGFKVSMILNETPSTITYLAHYGQSSWEITLLNAAQFAPGDNLNIPVTELKNEAKLHQQIGDTVYVGPTGSFSKGENAFYAVPYKPQTKLADFIDTIPANDSWRIDIALAIAKKLAHIEKQGILINNLSPNSITIGESLNSIGIADLSAAKLVTEPAAQLTHLIPSTLDEYTSPEHQSVQEIAKRIISTYPELEKIDLQDKSNEEIIEEIRAILVSALIYFPDQTLTTNIINTAMSLIKTVPDTGEHFTPQSLVNQIDDAFSLTLSFILDYRSDIYTFGKILRNDILGDEMSDKLFAIADNACAELPENRYKSFSQIYNDLKTYKYQHMRASSVSKDTEEAVDDNTANLAFGTICDDTDYTGHTALNEQIKQQFERNNLEPADDPVLMSSIIDLIQSWDYNEFAATPKAGAVLADLKITTEQQWQTFIAQVTMLASKATIYKLPADDYLLWVNQRFAAAHFGTFENRNNIYLTDRFMNLLNKKEQAQVVLHELLHLAGLNHAQADIIQQTDIQAAPTFNGVYNLVYFIANLELHEKIDSFDQNEFQRFVDMFIPAFKQAMDRNKIFDQDQFKAILRQYQFSATFSKRIMPMATELLATYKETGQLPDPAHQHITSKQIERLIAQLDSPTLFVRMKAIDTLVAIGRPAVRPLIAAIKQADASTKKHMLYILGLIGDPAAMPTAIGHLEHRSTSIKQAAQQAVINLTSSMHKAMLHSLIRSDQDDFILITALLACEKIGSYPALDFAAFYQHPNEQVRDLVGKILLKQGIDRSTEIGLAAHQWELIKGLAKFEDNPDFESAVFELTAQGEVAAPFLRMALTAKSHSSSKRWATLLLGELGDGAAIRPLLELTRTAPESKQPYILKLLQNPKYSEQLLTIVSNEDSDDSAVAAKVLGMTAYAPSFDQLQAVVLNEQNTYSFPTIQQALYSLADNMDKNTLTTFLTEVVTNRIERNKTNFDDAVLLLEVAVLIKQHSLKKAKPVLRELLRDPHPSIIKASIEGLAELGDAKDVFAIKLFGLRHEKLHDTVDQAVAKLNSPWSKIKTSFLSQVGFFAGGMPSDQFFTSDNYVHKGNLIGIDQIREFGDFEPITVHIPWRHTFYTFTIEVDTDFQQATLPSKLSKNTIALMIENMLEEQPDIARALHGKTITLALLTKSFRLSENHRADSFIGMNESIMHIADRGSMLLLFKELLYHELKHEADLAPSDFTSFTEWEADEMGSIVQSIISILPYKGYLQQFINHIRPAFSDDSFFVFILQEIQQGRLHASELDLLKHVDIGDSYDSLTDNFKDIVLLYRTTTPTPTTPSTMTNRLKALGLLDQDISKLLVLSPQEHIDGSYEGIAVQSETIKQQIQDIFLEVFVQKLLSRMLENKGYGPMFTNLFDTMMLHDLDPSSIRTRITESKQFISQQLGVTLNTSTSSDGYFMSIYVMEYLMGLYTGKQSVATLHPNAESINPYLIKVIKDREHEMYGQIRFNTDAIVGTPKYREAQKTFVTHLLALSNLQFMPISLFTDEEMRISKPTTPQRVKIIHIEQQAQVETSL